MKHKNLNEISQISELTIDDMPIFFKKFRFAIKYILISLL